MMVYSLMCRLKLMTISAKSAKKGSLSKAFLMMVYSLMCRLVPFSALSGTEDSAKWLFLFADTVM